MKNNDFIKVLLLNDLFTDFSYNELSNIFNQKKHKIKNYEKGSVIYFQNENCTTLDLILSGNIVVQKIDENGSILTVTHFSDGDVIGGNLLFAENNFYPMTISTKSKCEIVHINKDLILELCQMNTVFLTSFLKCISDKTLVLTNKINSISLKTIKQKIIDFLIYEYYVQHTTKIKLTMTKKELAEKFGIQRTSLSRELDKMRRDGLIDFTKDFIIIKNKLLCEIHN